MIKSILVPVTGTVPDTKSLDAALRVARLFDAHLDVLHVRIDPTTIAAAIATVDGGILSAGLTEQWELEARECAARTQKAFIAFCERNGLTASDDSAGLSAAWWEEMGDFPGWIAEYGRAADLLVISRPDPESKGMVPALLEAALLDTGRPLLVPGGASPPSMPPETVAVAWKSTRESGRAVAAAMPFFARAKDVVVFTVSEDGGAEKNAAGRIERTLRRHGPNVSARILQSDGKGAAETLLSAARDVRADLLVMGGYGRSRFREFIFGGFTTYVLRGAEIPVLMAH
jgi:nucleotide-binding universal stress UspA family protein